MVEVGAEKLFGSQLEERVNKIFARNQITPAIARNEIQQLFTQLRSFREALDWLLNAFGRLNIGKEQLRPGECEIGVLIPRMNVNNQLDKLAEELEELNRILSDFAELATGSRPGFEVKSVSTTDFSIFLSPSPITLASISFAVERIIAVYKNLLEIRKLKNELKENGIPDKQLQGVQDHANGIMENGIEAIKNDLFKMFYKQKDGGRENELRTAVGMSLRKIADRIDRGVNIEVRAVPPSVSQSAENNPEIEDKGSATNLWGDLHKGWGFAIF